MCIMETVEPPPIKETATPQNLIPNSVIRRFTSSSSSSAAFRVKSQKNRRILHHRTSEEFQTTYTTSLSRSAPGVDSDVVNLVRHEDQIDRCFPNNRGFSSTRVGITDETDPLNIDIDKTQVGFNKDTYDQLNGARCTTNLECDLAGKLQMNYLLTCSDMNDIHRKRNQNHTAQSVASSKSAKKNAVKKNHNDKQPPLPCDDGSSDSRSSASLNRSNRVLVRRKNTLKQRSRSSSSSIGSKSPQPSKKTFKGKSSGIRKWTTSDGMIALALTAFSTLCYVNSLNGDFVHDDLMAVTTNPDVTGKNSIYDLLKNDFWGRPMSDPASHKSYRPLTVLTFRWNAALWGVNKALSFHATNVALHSLVVLLLVRFCKEVLVWKREASTTAAILFASHPVHTEAVSSIVGRADVLCCALYLSSLIAFAKESTLWQTVGIICGGLALLAKEHGITVFCMCLTYQVLALDERKRTRNCVKNKRSAAGIECRIVVQLVAMLSLVYIRERMLHGTLPQFSEQDNPAAFSKSLLTKLLTYMYLPAFNLWLLLCPSNLSYDWQMGSIPLVESFGDTRNFATMSYVVALIALAARAVLPSTNEPPQGIHERKQQVLTLTLMVFPFLPASNLFVTVGFVVAERVLYIPSLGFCLLVSHGLQRLTQRGPVTAWLCRLCALLLVLVFVLKTVTRNNTWSSRESLFASGLDSVPGNAKVHYNYANHKKDTGDKRTAIEHYKIALSLWPNHASSHNNLGTLLEDSEAAEYHFKAALRINPCHAKAHYNLATIYSKKGQKDVTESLLLRAVTLDSDLVAAWSALASLYGDDENKSKEAEKLHRWAVTLDPSNADALNNYGAFLEKIGRTEEARIQYEKAINVQPNHTVAIINAARSLRSLKHSRKAEEFYKRALKIREDPHVLDKLGLLYLSAGRYQEAKLLYEDLLNRYPMHNSSKLHYVQLLIEERSYQQAESILLTLGVILESSHRREVYHLLATLYSLTNRTAEALDSILRALEGCPLEEALKCGRYHAEHGHILKDLDDYESAEESYKLALLLDPRLATAHLNLAVIYHIKGNYTSAQKHYQEAYNLDSTPTVLLDNMKKLKRRLLVDDRRCWWTESACRPE